MEPPGPQLEAPEWAAVCPPGPKAAQEEPSPSRDRVSRVEPDIQMVSNEEDDQLETRVGKTGIIHRVCYLQLLMFQTCEFNLLQQFNSNRETTC